MPGSSSTIKILGFESFCCRGSGDENSVMFANLIVSGKTSSRNLLYVRRWLDFLGEDSEGRSFGSVAGGLAARPGGLLLLLAGAGHAGVTIGAKSSVALQRTKGINEIQKT